MNNTIISTVLAAVIGGALVSLLVYGGLWATLQLMTKSRRPAVFTVLSFFIRSAGAVAVLIAVARIGSWPALVGAAGVTVIARIVMPRVLKFKDGEVQP
jgi:F1F0 ATPase subunit 2